MFDRKLGSPFCFLQILFLSICNLYLLFLMNGSGAETSANDESHSRKNAGTNELDTSHRIDGLNE